MADIYYRNIVANDSELTVNLEFEESLSAEKSSLNLLMLYALNCDSAFNLWESSDFCPRVSSRGVHVLGASVIGYRRKIFNVNGLKRMVYAPIRVLPKVVQVNFAEKLVSRLLCENPTYDSDTIDYSIDTYGCNYRQLKATPYGLELCLGTHEAFKYFDMHQPLTDLELSTGIGKVFIRMAKRYQECIDIVKYGSMSGFVHANEKLWLNSSGYEFVPNLHQMSRMSSRLVYPDPCQKNLYTDLLDMSDRFNLYLHDMFELTGYSELPKPESRNDYYLPYSIRYGPFVIENKRYGFIAKEYYNDMSIYVPSASKQLVIRKEPWTYTNAELLGLVYNTRRRAYGIATGIMVKSTSVEEARYQINNASLFPSDPILHRLSQFNVFESLNKGIDYIHNPPAYEPVKDLIKHVRMRCFYSSILNVSAGRGFWWSHDRPDPLDIARLYNLDVDESVFKIGNAILESVDKTAIPKPAFDILLHLGMLTNETCVDSDYNFETFREALEPYFSKYNL